MEQDERSPEMERRKSVGILKAQKPRNPLSEVDLLENADTTLFKSRRVSFATSHYVKPFSADTDVVTTWDDTYEEAMKHTDSSTHSSKDQISQSQFDITKSAPISISYDNSEVLELQALKKKVQVPTIVVYSDENAVASISDVKKDVPILDKENLNPIIHDTSILTFAKRKSSFGKLETFANDNADSTYLPSEFDITVADKTFSSPLPSSFLNNMTPNKTLKQQKFSKQSTEDEENCQKENIILNEIKLENIIKTNFNVKENCNINESNMELTANLESKTILFDQTSGDMDVTNFPLEVKEVEENILTKNKRKTIIFDKNSDNMEFTMDLNHIAAQISKNIYTTNSNVGENCKTQINEVEENILTKHKRKTIIFDKSSGDMELTTNLNHIAAQISENKSDLGNKEKNIQLDQTGLDMDITNFPAEVEENILLKNKRKTIIFDKSSGDMELTTNFNHIAAQISENKSDSGNKEKTIQFNQTALDMDITNFPSEVEENILLKNKRKTIIFDKSSGDMELTTNLNHIAAQISENKSDSGNKEKNIQLDQTALDMDITNFPSEIEENILTKNKRKTIIFDKSSGDMELTTNLNHIAAQISENKSDSGNKEKTIQLHQTALDMDTTNFPSEVEENILTKKRKTIIFDKSSGDMELATNLNHIAAQIFENKSDSGNKEKNIQLNQTPLDMDITNFSSEVEENILTKKRKTIIFDKSSGDMEFTTNLNSIAAQISENKSDSENKEKNLQLDQTALDMDITNFPSEVEENILTKNKRKTIIFDKSSGDMEFTTNLNHIAAQIFENKSDSGNKEKNTQLNQTPLDMDITNFPSEVEKNILTKKRKTIIFDKSSAAMEFTTNLNSIAAQISENKSDSENKEKNIQLDQTALDMDITNFPSEVEENFLTKNKRKTIIFDKSSGDMELTTNLNHIAAQISENKSDSGNKEKTIQLHQTALDMDITNFPSEVEKNILFKNKRKTIIFDKSSGDMEFTRHVDHIAAQTSKNINKTNSNVEENCKTQRHEEDVKFPTHYEHKSELDPEVEENIVTKNKRKTIIFDKNSDNMEFTVNLNHVTAENSENIKKTNSNVQDMVFRTQEDKSVLEHTTVPCDQSAGDITNFPQELEDEETLIKPKEKISLLTVPTPFETFSLPKFTSTTNFNDILSSKPPLEQLKISCVEEKECPIINNDKDDRSFLPAVESVVMKKEEKRQTMFKPHASSFDLNSYCNQTKTFVKEPENCNTTVEAMDVSYFPEIKEQPKAENSIIILDDDDSTTDKFKLPYINENCNIFTSTTNFNNILGNKNPISELHSNLSVIEVSRSHLTENFVENVDNSNSVCNEDTQHLINLRLSDANEEKSTASEDKNTFESTLERPSFSMFKYIKENLVKYVVKDASSLMRDVREQKREFERLMSIQVKFPEIVLPDFEEMDRLEDACEPLEEPVVMDDDVEEERPIPNKFEEIEDMCKDYIPDKDWVVFEKRVENKFVFLSFNRAVQTSLSVDDDLFISDIETRIIKPNNANPICRYIVKMFCEQLKTENLLHTFGSPKICVKTFIDYIDITIDQLLDLHIYVRDLTCQCLDISADGQIFTIKLLNADAPLWWEINLDMSNPYFVNPENVTAVSKCHRHPVNETIYKEMCKNCPNGPKFLKEFMSRLEPHKNTTIKRLLMKTKKIVL